MGTPARQTTEAYLSSHSAQISPRMRSVHRGTNDLGNIYLSSIQRAIDFIEDHLQEHISAEEVAFRAGFSEYHFHRIFSEVLGESVKEYVLRRRLTHAAQQLEATETPIIDIAFRSGFKSQESFTRAFQKLFGTTPGRYRRFGTTTPFSERAKTRTT